MIKTKFIPHLPMITIFLFFTKDAILKLKRFATNTSDARKNFFSTETSFVKSMNGINPALLSSCSHSTTPMRSERSSGEFNLQTEPD